MNNTNETIKTSYSFDDVRVTIGGVESEAKPYLEKLSEQRVYNASECWPIPCRQIIIDIEISSDGKITRHELEAVFLVHKTIPGKFEYRVHQAVDLPRGEVKIISWKYAD